MTATESPITDLDLQLLVRLHPGQVGQHPQNLRDSTRDIQALAASIKEVGVLVPLLVVPVHTVPGNWAPDVTHVAVDGNRRQAAAALVDADLPCLVSPGDSPATRTMAVTNLARDGLTVPEQVHAVQAMLDFGISQSAISRATGLKPKTVRAARAAAGLSGAAAAVAAEHHDLTLDQLAVLAEWQDDAPSVQTLMTAVKRGPGMFEHAHAVLRDERKAAKAVAAVVARLTGEGVTVVDTPPTRGSGHGPVRVDCLVGAAAGRALTEAAHAECPGRAVWVGTDYDDQVTVVACCVDPTGNGHTPLYGPGSRPPGQLTPQEKEDRRELIRRNREMVAAQQVRIAFLARMQDSAGPTAKDVMCTWALHRVLNRNQTFLRWDGHQVIDQILGGRETVQAAPAHRYPMLLWAQVTAAYETEFAKDSWRHPDQGRAGYLQHLIDLGYTPCDTEQLIITEAPR